MEETLSKLNGYKRVIEVEDFIDFLYSNKLISEENYYVVQQKKQSARIHELFEIIHSKENLETVFDYLKDRYPEEANTQEQERAYRVSVALGGFPKLPPNYIPRQSLVEDVRRKFLNLEWKTKLVIHGMMGYGKSCLVNEILSDSTVRKYFDNCIFWIKLGDCHQKEDALQPMWRLYTTASEMISQKISHNEDDVDNLKRLLIMLFIDNRLKNSLLILDDANNEEVLECFDIVNCKTVITTQNKNILRNEEAVLVEVKTGFSRRESLNLFKKSLKVDHELPAAADEIHSICQGHPMLIALIGSYLSENADYIKEEEGKSIWDFVKTMVMKGHYRLNKYNTTEVDILQMIKKCIENLLTSDLKDLYEDLAIFPPDVNIPPEVLKTLWDVSHDDVRNIMNKFAEKSLIVPFYHKDLKTYIYGIHDIHLNYLKDITKDCSVLLHRKLLSGYDRLTGKNYANLPNDNYTLQFIGYHLYYGEYFDRFDIYFDLRFLAAKVKAVGKEDVLRDMDKYQIYITREDNILSEKLKQYKDFIKRCGGNLYSYEKTDIIQYALRENRDSYVFKDAIKLAKTGNQLYLQLQKPCEEFDYSQKINVKDDITSACFVDSPQSILIGTTNGKIKLFYEQSVKEIANFVGHEGAIKSLIISPDKSYFLSVSIDGTVLMWKFAADSARNSRDFTNLLQISPKSKQSYWQDMHTADRGQVSPRKRFGVFESEEDHLISAGFCNNFPNTFRIITGSERGNVSVWDARTETRLFSTGPRGMPAPCVLYLETHIMILIAFACQDDIFVYRIKDDQPSFHCQLHNANNCNSLFASDDNFFAISDKNLKQWRWEKGRMEMVYNISDPTKVNICSTLTVDNQFLVVSTNKNTVYIWDIQKKKLLREFPNKGLAKSLDTFYDEDRSVHILLIGSDRKTLQQCHIQPYEREPHTENMPICTPFWRKNNVLTAVISKENKIQVFSGYIIISESEVIHPKVTCTCFSVCGNEVIYGLSNGEVHIFKIRSKTNTCLQEATGAEVTYLKSYDPSNSYYNRTPTGESGGSFDSLDFLDCETGLLIVIFGDELVKIYKGNKVYEKKIVNPTVFHKLDRLIFVDNFCQIYDWQQDNGFADISNSTISKTVQSKLAVFASHNSHLALFYKQDDWRYMDILSLADSSKSLRHEKLADKVRSACFSGDGSLLAVGFMSGNIEVWNLRDCFKRTTLKLHDDPVEGLLFSPNFEPILISLGTEIAWWNLKSLKKIVKSKGRPKSIDILENVPYDLCSMDFSYWRDRTPLDGNDFLLSCMKLGGKAKYMSASNDFDSFLAIDDNGKVYIMEIVRPDN
ncbi:death-associated APAF1-related killer isoform X1 [Leptinotarsa decemlineata]|uniref:death-associated APAF1-related killer isoform X1 n=2 Tax=Leptinotarsa decemlineata TaxID=7539 RepID=UPI003D307B82